MKAGLHMKNQWRLVIGIILILVIVIFAILNIEVGPAYDNQKIKTNFTKNYRFSPTQKEWNESTWSFPDLPFPQQK